MFNLEDCFNHMMYSSDPVVRKEAKIISEEKETKKEDKPIPEPKEKYEDDYVFESLLAKEDQIEE